MVHDPPIFPVDASLVTEFQLGLLRYSKWPQYPRASANFESILLPVISAILYAFGLYNLLSRHPFLVVFFPATSGYSIAISHGSVWSCA